MPGAGVAVSGGIAGAITDGIGKSAEAYFFRGEVRKPRRYFLEWARRKETEEPPSPNRTPANRPWRRWT